MKPIIRRTVLASAVVLALAATACGDDDDDDAKADATATDADDAGGGGDDLDAYCEASFAIGTAPEPEIDFETATPEEISAGVKTYVTEDLQPLVDDVLAVAPDELADDADVLAGALAEMGETGDFAAFETPEVQAADDRVHAFDLENCGWAQVDVTAKEYAYDGIPDELEAGPTSFEFANEGKELHELGMVRVNDGVTETTDELLALPEEQVMEKITFMGSPAFADPGSGEYKVVDLEPGRYIVACFVPVGTTSQEAPPVDGPPHAFQGMVAEFTVA